MVQDPPEGMPDLSGVERSDPDDEILVLVVEDDLGYAVLVEELLADSGEPIKVVVARSVDEASALVSSAVTCVLLDLGLPDAEGLDALEGVLAAAPDVAVVVLTGRAESDLALGAVAAGAQDYLTKDLVDAASLTRSIRYAVARKGAIESSRRLVVTEVMAAEQARLERGLLPSPLLRDPRIAWASRYRPAGSSLLLGGDFFDLVELPDSRLRVVIGDVCGHGPDEAALGVALRIAWRSLVLAGIDDDEVLSHVESILKAERGQTDLFVTVCDLTVSTDRRALTLRVAGHPPPVLMASEVDSLQAVGAGPPLGVLEDATWPTVTVSLDPGWALLLYTDGLVEGRTLDGRRCWSLDGLLHGLRHARAGESRRDLGVLADYLIESAVTANGGPLDDDLALLILAEQS
jgi:serine phosphatase RsbU (regulator of sigma subunit)